LLIPHRKDQEQLKKEKKRKPGREKGDKGRKGKLETEEKNSFTQREQTS